MAYHIVKILRREREWLFKARQPKTVIAGLPRSGSTMLYYNIKQSSPFASQCRYLFEPPRFNYDLNNYSFKQAVLAKILIGFVDYSSFRVFDKKIMLIRDPRDIIISRILYEGGFHTVWNKTADEIERTLELLKKKSACPDSVSVTAIWKSFWGSDPLMLNNWARKHFELFLRFYRENKNYFLVKYEDLIRGRLDGLENYLGFKLQKNVRVEKGFSRVERTKNTGDWMNWFTDQDISFLKPLCLDHMKVFGYDYNDWTVAAKPTIAPEHSFEYVKRLVNEQRRRANLPEI